MKGNTSQQTILEAVITCIEKYGLEKVTTRKIADEAGTNIASINYYFRSKDDLIAQALGTALKHMEEDLIAIVQNEGQSFDVILRSWVTYLLEGAQRYPRVIMAHMYAPLVEKRFDTPAPRAFRTMLDMLRTKAIQAYPRKDAEKLQVVLADMISSMLFRILSPGFFEEKDNLPIDELAERYVAMFEQMISVN